MYMDIGKTQTSLIEILEERDLVLADTNVIGIDLFRKPGENFLGSLRVEKIMQDGLDQSMMHKTTASARFFCYLLNRYHSLNTVAGCLKESEVVLNVIEESIKGISPEDIPTQFKQTKYNWLGAAARYQRSLASELATRSSSITSEGILSYWGCLIKAIPIFYPRHTVDYVDSSIVAMALFQAVVEDKRTTILSHDRGIPNLINIMRSCLLQCELQDSSLAKRMAEGYVQVATTRNREKVYQSYIPWNQSSPCRSPQSPLDDKLRELVEQCANPS